MNDQIAELWNSGLTSSAIAQRMGITRSAVLGRVSRLKKQGVITRIENIDKRNHRWRKPAEVVRAPRPVVPTSPVIKMMTPKPPKPVVPEPVLVWPPAKPTEPKLLLELGYNECRFPVRSERDIHHFCAKPIKQNSCYCPEHHAICYNGFRGQK